MDDENKIDLNPETSLNTADKLKQSGFKPTVDGKEVNIDEGDTMLDLFPEISEEEPMAGGEVKDIKEKPKNKDKKKEITKIGKKVKKENFMTKNELLETIGVYENGAPAPTKTPTRVKPGEKQRPKTPKTPFRPKITPKPKAGGLPSWLKSEAIGITDDAPAPTKTPTRVKPGEKQRPKTPKTPFRPKITPKPKATANALAENKKKNKLK